MEPLLICERSDNECYECDHIKPHHERYGCGGANCLQKKCRPKCISLEEYYERNEFIGKEEFEI